MMSPLLRAFLSDWLAWAEAGAPDDDRLARHWGLCGNAIKNGVRRHLERLLETDFPDNASFPFGGSTVYHRDAYRREHHLNEERLAWVRAKLAEPDDE